MCKHGFFWYLRKENGLTKLYENFELRLLIDCITTQINEESGVKVFRDVDWGKLYSMAKNHRVANSLYTTTIGIRGESIEQYRGAFDKEYRRAYQMNDKYAALEKNLYKTLEKNQIHSLILTETILRKCYKKGEFRAPWDLDIYIERKSFEKIKDIMHKMEFEEIPSECKDEGMRFINDEGLNVVFISSFKFSSNEMNKFFSVPPKKFPTIKNHEYVHQHSLTDFYIFFISRLAESFANGDTKIRDIVDLWELYLLCYDTMDWKFIYNEFAKFKIGEFAELIIKLAANWFGDQQFEEDEEQIEHMEAYIASGGSEYKQENSAILPFIGRDKELEKIYHKQKIEEIFPEMANEDSEAIYPRIRKSFILKTYFWLSKNFNEEIHKLRLKIIKMVNSIHNKFIDDYMVPIEQHKVKMAKKRLENKHKRRLERALYMEKKLYEREQNLYDRIEIKEKERELKWRLMDVRDLIHIEKEELAQKEKDFEDREGITRKEKLKEVAYRWKNKISNKFTRKKKEKL